MSGNGHAKIQHYVPQFLLKNFGKGKKSSVLVFDKKLKKTYKTNTKNIASENKFYDFEFEIENHKIVGSIEEKLCEIEGNANTSLKKIIKSDSVSIMNDTDKKNLSIFLAAQVVRTKNSRINYERLSEFLKKALEQRGYPQNLLEEELSNKHTDLLFDTYVVKLASKMAELFFEKIWIWGKNDTNIPFCIGDDPVVCHNDFIKEEESLLFSPHAFGVVGATIYLPITPTRILCLFCPVKAREIIKTINEIKNMFLYKPFDLEIYSNSCQELYNAFINKAPVLFDKDNVMHVNSLEILYAERYIINTDFEFLKLVLDKEGNYKHHGRRIEVR